MTKNDLATISCCNFTSYNPLSSVFLHILSPIICLLFSLLPPFLLLFLSPSPWCFHPSSHSSPMHPSVSLTEDQGGGSPGSWRGQLPSRRPSWPQGAHLPAGPQWEQGSADEGSHPHHRRNHDVKEWGGGSPWDRSPLLSSEMLLKLASFLSVYLSVWWTDKGFKEKKKVPVSNLSGILWK